MDFADIDAGCCTLRLTTLVAALLGVLHGLGFSIVLREILKLDAPKLWQSVLAFNVGIEIGQLLIVLALWPSLSVHREEITEVDHPRSLGGGAALRPRGHNLGRRAGDSILFQPVESGQNPLRGCPVSTSQGATATGVCVSESTPMSSLHGATHSA